MLYHNQKHQSKPNTGNFLFCSTECAGNNIFHIENILVEPHKLLQVYQ